MKNSKGKGLLIEHECPQCGGPVVLEETDRLFLCGYCRVRLYITAKNYFRYFLSPKKNYPEDTIFIPYWRFRGTCFTLRPFNIRERVLDTNFLATDHSFLPYSLGFRAQTQKLRFADRNIKADIINHSIPFDKVFNQVETVKHFTDNLTYPGRILYNAFIGDTTSIIYSPVYIRNRAIYDSVLERPLAKYTLLRAEDFSSVDKKRNWGARFIPALCPDCGWDLDGDRDSIVLLCKNCNTAWKESESSIRRLEFGIMHDKNIKAAYVPFWKMKIKVEGISLETYADLARLANLPRVITDQLEKKELFLWAPAFRARPKLFLRVAKQLTILQPEGRVKTELPGSDLYPVTLDTGDILETVKVMIADMAVSKKKIFPLIPELKLKMKDSFLLYLPFKEKGNELIQTEMKFSILINALRR